MPKKVGSAGEMAVPAVGCLPDNHARDVLEIMTEAGVDVMPVVGSFQAPRVLGLVAREDLTAVAGKVGAAEAKVADARWSTPPQVGWRVSLLRILEAPDRAEVYVVVDDHGGLVGLLHPGHITLDGPAGSATDAA